MGKTWDAPITAVAREAVERALKKRRVVGKGWLFPPPIDSDKAGTLYMADAWLRKGEKRAELEPQQGTLWHAYRRLWASARKHLPAKDVAAAGGWKCVSVVQDIYQQADEETLLRVVTEGAEIRKVR